MRQAVIAFVVGVTLGASVMSGGSVAGQASAPAAGTHVTQLRLYTIDKGKLGAFADAWRAGVYPLRTKLGYRIPFAAKIPSTNQFVWLLTYDGPKKWEDKEAEYYASDDRKRVSPDPAQWIARPEQLTIETVVNDFPSTPLPAANAEAELAALEQAIVKSAVSGDRQTYGSILDPDWRTIHINGDRLTKAQVLDMLFAAKPGPLADSAIDDVNVRLFGDTAVVTGRTTAKPRTGDAIVLRFTDVFVRRDGRWQVVASQGTRIAS